MFRHVLWLLGVILPFKVCFYYIARLNWLLLIMMLVMCYGIFGSAQVQSANAVTPKTKIFGKMEIRSPVKSVPKWIRVLRENKVKAFFADDRKIQDTTWGALKNKWKDLPIKEKLRTVNLFWNKWPYRQDVDVYKVLDYWAVPREFYENSGDCEDYSIMKYYSLIELGVSKENMRIAIVKEIIRNIAHAVLVVYVGNEAYVLDSLSNQLLSHKVYRHYDLRYTVNEFYKWSHFKAKTKSKPKYTPRTKAPRAQTPRTQAPRTQAPR